MQYHKERDHFPKLMKNGRVWDLAHVNLEDEKFEDNIVTIKGRKVINFQSCSYLGLEFHPEIIKASKDAIDRYGSNFCVSRAALSMPLYKQLDLLLEKIFGGPVLVTSSTSIATQILFMTQIDPGDVILLDRMCHMSIQYAAAATAAILGVSVKFTTSDEESILTNAQKLSTEYTTVWFASDGLHSVSGQLISPSLVRKLLNISPKIRVVIDDAHSISIIGDRGEGHFLASFGRHDRTFVVASLTKGMACRGGCIVFPNEEAKDRSMERPSPYIFGGPEPPSVIGSCIAAAKLHLDGTVKLYQEELSHKIKLFYHLAEKVHLPFIPKNDNIPIIFVLVGEDVQTVEIARDLMKYHGISCFTGVSGVSSKGRAGLRLSVTRLLTVEQIVYTVDALSKYLPRLASPAIKEYLNQMRPTTPQTSSNFSLARL